MAAIKLKKLMKGKSRASIQRMNVLPNKIKKAMFNFFQAV